MIVRSPHFPSLTGFGQRVLCSLLVLTAFGPSAASPSMAQNPNPLKAVLTEQNAYMPLPAELIAGPVVQHVSVSPLSRNVAALRMSMRLKPENVPSAANPHPARPSQEQEIIFWNAGTRRPVTLWQSAQPETNVTFTDWMPGTESLYAVIDRQNPPDPQRPGELPDHEWKLALLGFGIERAVIVPIPPNPQGYTWVSVSPEKPLAVLIMSSNKPDQPQILTLLHPNGRVGARIETPAGANVGVLWDAAGNLVLAATPQGKGVRAFYGVDTRTGQTSLLPKKPEWHMQAPAPKPALPFVLLAGQQSVTQADTVERTHPIWLESLTKGENRRTLLAANGDIVGLLPGGEGALFKAEESLWFTPIFKLNKAEYLAARAAAQRQVALSNAKQLGLGVIMYAMDNKEVLPGPDGIEANISPYLKNDSLFAGFTYTFPGGSLADVPSPSETVLGFVAGPGGRAVVYVDGHAKWKSD